MRNRSGWLLKISLFIVILLVFAVPGTLAIVAFSTPEGAWGTVHVDGEPVGMSITLDGITSGVVPSSGVLELPQIPIGGHSIGATMEGYQGKETPLTVFDGQISKVRIDLIAIGTGTLTVDSNPTNVQMYLDDVYKGITPVTLTRIPVGGHMVLLKLAGYQDWSSPVTVTAGGQELVSGTLERTAPDSGDGKPVATSAAAAGSLPGVVIFGVFISMVGCFLIYPR
ncbi:MAG: PEGA domain-containing protein [Methanobacteriota archaeon]